MDNKFKILRNIFHILCLIFTLFCLYKCFYQWSLDLDISAVEYKEYGYEGNYIKPTMSMCFFDPFDAKAFDNDRLGPEINISVYKKLLFGTLKEETFNPELLTIDFENVTLDIKEYLKGYAIGWDNDTFRFYNMTSLPPGLEMPYQSYVGSYHNWILKCYSIDIPIDASTFQVGLISEIFPNKTLPSTFGFAISFHYRNQFLKSFENMKMTWTAPDDQSQKTRSLLMKINSFEVTIRRKTKNRPCNADWLNDDQLVYEEFLTRGGKCRPPYKIWNSTYPVCDTIQKMYEANYHFGRQRDKYMEPCQNAEKVIYESQVVDFSKLSMDSDYYHRVGLAEFDYFFKEGSFIVVVEILSNRFKVIKHVQQYDLQSLIGNSGGYIGLFLGTI